MNDYALLINGNIERIERRESRPPDIPHKGVKWYPVVNETGKEFYGLIGDNWVIRVPKVDHSIVHVPAFVSPRQIRILLLQKGLLEKVENLISQQDELTKITWEYALEFRRDDPLLNSLIENLKLTKEQVDTFFIEASKI